MDVVWLKKDVRLRDHAPLSKALSSSERPVLILYVYEDDQLQHHSVHGSHIFFSNEGLADVEEQLCTVLGTGKRCITLVRGEITAALEAVSAAGPGRIVELLSHEETGHLISYERDKRVRRWCKKRGVVWREFQQNGIIRGLKDRVKADFAKRWTAHMTSKIPGSLSDDDVMRRQLENRLIRGLHCQGSVDSLLVRITRNLHRICLNALDCRSRPGPVAIPDLRRPDTVTEMCG